MIPYIKNIKKIYTVNINCPCDIIKNILLVYICVYMSKRKRKSKRNKGRKKEICVNNINRFSYRIVLKQDPNVCPRFRFISMNYIIGRMPHCERTSQFFHIPALHLLFVKMRKICFKTFLMLIIKQFQLPTVFFISHPSTTDFHTS